MRLITVAFMTVELESCKLNPNEEPGTPLFAPEPPRVPFCPAVALVRFKFRNVRLKEETAWINDALPPFPPLPFAPSPSPLPPFPPRPATNTDALIPSNELESELSNRMAVDWPPWLPFPPDPPANNVSPPTPPFPAVKFVSDILENALLDEYCRNRAIILPPPPPLVPSPPGPPLPAVKLEIEFPEMRLFEELRR